MENAWETNEGAAKELHGQGPRRALEARPGVLMTKVLRPRRRGRQAGSSEDSLRRPRDLLLRSPAVPRHPVRGTTEWCSSCSGMKARSKAKKGRAGPRSSGFSGDPAPRDVLVDDRYGTVGQRADGRRSPRRPDRSSRRPWFSWCAGRRESAPRHENARWSGSPGGPRAENRPELCRRYAMLFPAGDDDPAECRRARGTVMRMASKPADGCERGRLRARRRPRRTADIEENKEPKKRRPVARTTTRC